MADFLYTVFICPLEFLIRLSLENILALTQSPMLSLIGVSVLVTLASLPLYHLAEQWQDAERAIQRKLKPKVKEFKSIFKGAQLNAYLRTLYRQNNYHPIYAVRTSFGLLIQIPFFFAAYHLLSNYHQFNGVETFLFADLGKPDGLMKIGGFSINLLPIIMTGVNLFSASIYGTKISLKEKVQLYAMALLFLVVLYDSPAALLFYWTSNNILGLAKNALYRLFYDKGSLDKKAEFKARRLPQSLVRINSYVATRWWPHFLVLLLCFFLFFCAFEATKSAPFLSSAALSIGLVFSCILVVFPVLEIYTNHTNKTSLAMVVIYLAMFSFGLFLLALRFLSENSHGTLRTLTRNTFYALIFLDFIRWLSSISCSFIDKNDLTITKRRGTIFFLVLSSLTVLVFFAGPLTLLASGGAGDFEESLSFFLNFLLMLAINIGFIITILYVYMSPAQKTLFIYIFGVITLFATSNCFLFPGNHGDMSNFVFEEGIAINNYHWLNFLILFFILVSTSILFWKKRALFFIPIFTISLVSLTVLSVAEASSFINMNKVFGTSKAEKLEPAFVFSKDKPNILIVLLDRFLGGYVPDIFRLSPGLEDRFVGFTWYPESLSDGDTTIAGMPSIMGGWEYHVHEVQHARTNIPLKKKLDETIRILPYNLNKVGFKSTIYAPLYPYWDKSDTSYLENTVIGRLDGRYSEIWKQKQNYEQTKSDVRQKLAMFGLFRVAPPIIRKSIYDEGRWRLGDRNVKSKKAKEDSRFVYTRDPSAKRIESAIDHFATLDFLPELSTAKEDEASSFVLLANSLTHEPWVINSDLQICLTGECSYPKNVYKKFKSNMKSVQHLYADLAAFNLIGDWFDWMRENDVYDNTRIIVASDHGGQVITPEFQQWLPFSSTKGTGAHFHNLLFVKDFESRGKLITSNEFMATCDVPYLAMRGIIEGENPFTGKPIVERKDKFPFYLYRIPWRIQNQQKYQYVVSEAYMIKKQSIFEINNWQLYDDK